MAQIASLRTEALDHLARHSAIWRGSDLARVGAPSVATGFPELDAELPGGGWPAGALTEILPAHEGIGELRILGPALASLSAKGCHLAWIAPPHLPYAPALAAAGIDLAQLLVVKTRSAKETLWATEQALRSHACGAVLAWPQLVRYPELRRLAIAAEGGRSLVLLFREPRAANESSPAALRIALAAANGGLAVHILKRRGGPLDRPVLLPPVGRSIETGRHHVVDRRSPAATAARNVPVRLAHV